MLVKGFVVPIESADQSVMLSEEWAAPCSCVLCTGAVVFQIMRGISPPTDLYEFCTLNFTLSHLLMAVQHMHIYAQLFAATRILGR